MYTMHTHMPSEYNFYSLGLSSINYKVVEMNEMSYQAFINVWNLSRILLHKFTYSKCKQCMQTMYADNALCGEPG